MAELLFVLATRGPAHHGIHLILSGDEATQCHQTVVAPNWNRQQPPFVLTRVRFTEMSSDPGELYCSVCIKRAGELVHLP